MSNIEILRTLLDADVAAMPRDEKIQKMVYLIHAGQQALNMTTSEVQDAIELVSGYILQDSITLQQEFEKAVDEEDYEKAAMLQKLLENK